MQRLILMTTTAGAILVNNLFSRNGKFYWGRISNANLAISTNFKSKAKDAKKKSSVKSS